MCEMYVVVIVFLIYAFYFRTATIYYNNYIVLQSGIFLVCAVWELQIASSIIHLHNQNDIMGV